jgi:hypothetical protein
MFVLPKPAVNLVGDSTPKGPDGFGLAVALADSLGDVVPTDALEAHLGDGDPMQGNVELAIAATIEPKAVGTAGPNGDWCSAIVHGECGSRLEAPDAGDLTDQLGRGERSTALQGDETGGQLSGPSRDFALQVGDSKGQIPDSPQQLPGDLGNQAAVLGELFIQGLQDLGPIEDATLRGSPRREFVQMPTEPILNTGTLRHKVLTMVDQGPQFATWAIQLR